MDEGREATHGSEEFRALSTNQVPRVIRSRRKVLPQSGHRQGPMSPATVTSPYRSGLSPCFRFLVIVARDKGGR